MPFLIPLWAFFTSKIGMYVLFAVAALGAVWWFIAHEQNIGWRKALTKVDQQNERTIHDGDIVRKGFDTMCGPTNLKPDCVSDDWTRDK